MKNLLMGIMIVGIIAGIAAAFFGLKERTKFNIIAVEAKVKRDEAIEKQLRAEEAKRYAERISDEAERRQKRAEAERAEAVTKARESEKQAKAAERLKQEADQARKVSEDERDQALQEKETALKERDAMAEERDQAVADFEVEKKVRLIAEEKRDEAIEYRNKADEELTAQRELGNMATKTVSFVGAFNRILFPCIDDGDDYYLRGLITYALSGRPNKLKAVGFISRARDKYIEARAKLKRLSSIDDLTREIIELTQESTEENIKSVEIIHEVLSAMLRGTLPEVDRLEKYKKATKWKERADRLIIGVCDRLLEVIDTYKAGFTTAQRAHIEDLKKKINARVGPPTGSEETGPPPAPPERR